MTAALAREPRVAQSPHPTQHMGAQQGEIVR